MWGKSFCKYMYYIYRHLIFCKHRFNILVSQLRNAFSWAHKMPVSPEENFWGKQYRHLHNDYQEGTPSYRQTSVALLHFSLVPAFMSNPQTGQIVKAWGTTRRTCNLSVRFFVEATSDTYSWKRGERLARAGREYVNARHSHGCASCKYVVCTPRLPGCERLRSSFVAQVVGELHVLTTCGLCAIATLTYAGPTYTCCLRTVSLLTRDRMV